MKKKIFLRVFALALVLTLMMFIFGLVAINLNAKAMIKDRLQQETSLVCSMLKAREDFGVFDRYRGDDAFRISIFDTAGNVLYESDTASELENHADRQEVAAALEDSPLAVERYSQTFDCKMTYYAQKTVLQDGETVIVRLAVKSNAIDGYMAVAVLILLAVVAVAIVASAAIANVIAGRFSSKITDVGMSLESLKEGNYKPIVTDSKEPELYLVLGKINELSASIESGVRKVREEHRKLNIVLDNVSQGIIALGKNGKIAFANKSACQLFGQTNSVNDKDLIYLVDDVNLLEKLQQDFDDQCIFEYSYKDKCLAIVVKNADDSDSDVSRVIIVTDITQQKAAINARSEFFANASHELKTPVTVMQGLSELLLDKNSLDEQSKKQVERIHKESVRLASLIGDMLKLSQYERGEETANCGRVDLRAVAVETLAELGGEMEKKKIEFSIEGEGYVIADNKKIYELMQNLCSNAVNYNKENGKIAVEIIENDNNTQLKVSDTGIGIEQEHIPRLCERFYRVDKSRSKKTGGTGLGLAIVKHICATYNADLNIESSVGQGTTVTVTFPSLS
ncbi:MAG: ATP-binding protein [Christensenellales bacterium]